MDHVRARCGRSRRGAGIAVGKLESGITLAVSGAVAIWIALVQKRSAPDPWADDENDDAEPS